MKICFYFIDFIMLLNFNISFSMNFDNGVQIKSIIEYSKYFNYLLIVLIF